MKRFIYFTLLCALTSCEVRAQGSYEEFKRRMNREYSSFKSNRDKEYEDFRRKINEEYASLLKKSWEEFNAFRGIPAPEEDKPVPPVIYPEEDKDKPVKDNPKPFEEIIPIVKPEPQPEPVAPIKDAPKPPVETYYAFKFFNTDFKVRLEDKHRFRLQGCGVDEISRTWKVLSGNAYDNVINDCLAIRSKNKLCDWAYLQMLCGLSDAFFKGHCNEAVLFAAYLYCQSGYKMKLASAGNRLFLLYASNHTIYDTTYWEIENEKFYSLDCNLDQLNICQATFPQEKPLSLQIGTEQLLALQPSTQRTLQSEQYRDVKAVVNTNKNLIQFFDSYPASSVNDDFSTRWVIYANTPLSKQARSTLYPALKKVVDGKSQHDAVNRLLNFVQTAFVYEYDDKVWGCDRAFFADETLYYPYCDCEDRSILFSRLVRDLLGLKVVLLFYPGHLATAVCFTENVTGDHIVINGKRYTICDPTYIGAPVGATMPKMDNQKAKVILLE